MHRLVFWSWFVDLFYRTMKTLEQNFEKLLMEVWPGCEIATLDQMSDLIAESAFKGVFEFDHTPELMA